MRYDRLVEGALRGVMIEALTRASRKGLPGAHHFCISFRTDHPGVRISADLNARYPDEMTIVLQHQFWDLAVGEEAFEVSLSFDTVRERLIVPFEAVTAFADPSVKFGLQFQAGDGFPASGEGAPVKPPSKGAATPAQKRAARPKPAEEAAGQVVALDAFRKK